MKYGFQESALKVKVEIYGKTNDLIFTEYLDLAEVIVQTPNLHDQIYFNRSTNITKIDIKGIGCSKFDFLENEEQEPVWDEWI